MKKATIIVLIFSIFFSSNVYFVPQASAWLGITDTVTDSAMAGLTGAKTAMDKMYQSSDLANWAKSVAYAAAINYLKQKLIKSLLNKIQKTANARIIRNYNDYLYIQPEAAALKATTSFLTAATGGKTGAVYEGVGASYNNYLKATALKSISTPTIKINLSNQVSNANQVFSKNSMRPFSTYLECANNVFCLSLTAQSNYAAELEKKQTIAKEEGKNGYLPRKNANGDITSPSINISMSASNASSMAINAILGADSKDSGSAAAFATAVASIATSYIMNQ